MSSEEDYLIGKVLSTLKTDAASAKSWMLFAKSSFPQSFAIQFQAYKLERDQQNLHESASCLSDLIKKFPGEAVLVKELKSIADTLDSEKDDFLKRLYKQLSEEVKYEFMIAVTRNVKSVIEHCELMLLFLKRMSSSRLLQHGRNIIDSLLEAEEHHKLYTPINVYRKMLVCDTLPLILKVAQFESKSKIIFQLLQKSVEFYVCCILSPPIPNEGSVRREAIGFSDHTDDAWKPLLKLLETVAIHHRWSYPELFVSNFSDQSLQQLLSLLKRRTKMFSNLTNENRRREDVSGYEEIYFCLTVTFFYYLHHFGKIMHSRMFTNNITGPYNFLLMEGITSPQEECPRVPSSDFKRTEKGHVVVSKNATAEVSNMLIPAFVTAAECWELLHRNQYLLKDFKSVCKNILLDTWPIFQEFFIDLLIYQGAHLEAIEHLSRVQDTVSEPSHRHRAALQIASCFAFTGAFERALETLFSVVTLLTPSSSAYIPKPLLTKCPVRYIYFMGYNNKEILQYCVMLLLKLYKCKEDIDETFKDMALGFLFVLMQYDLDHEDALFEMCIEKIKQNKNFCFQKFFNYIIHVDILEEFSYLGTTAGGNINLDLLLTSTFQVGKQRAVTRGVNKGARDDLKQAFVNQMARCYENLENLYIEFITEEQHFLLLILTDG